MANMCATATLIATAALLRTESRGAHWRDDFPATDPAQATRRFLTLTQAETLRTTLTQVPHDPALA
jgi:L-aspartate oxidase